MKFALSLGVFIFVTFALAALTTPQSVLAVCTEDRYGTAAECNNNCTGGACTRGASQYGEFYECTNCPAPLGTCTSGTSAMASAKDCSNDCLSEQCLADSKGVKRCCVYFNDTTENACPNEASGYDTPALCSRDCNGTCVGDVEGDRRCCIASVIDDDTPPGLPEEKECINVGLGTCIPTNPKEFAGWILGLGIGLGTLLAVVFLVIGGVGVATSAGDPENLEKAKKQITAAVAGLLFILLSVLILNTIGGGIIGIPFFQ